MNHAAARASLLARSAKGFQSQPEPRTIGAHGRGKQLISGNFMFAGSLIEAKDTSIWALESPGLAFDEEIHGFTWLDDLAAVGDMEARRRAQDWTFDWIERFGRGSGPGWTPDLTGRRIIRWINHAIFLLNGRDKSASKLYFRSLGRQTIFLSRRWKVAYSGLPRFEALVGLIYAGQALEGMERLVDPAVKALARECADQVDPDGGIPTRNPEDLLEVFTLLTWASSALTDAGRMPTREHLAAIERIAPTLRALRHSDGGLARFHGGGRGLEGRLDQALAVSGVRGAPLSGLGMGFARLSSGRTSLIMDAAAPPKGAASYNGHASTLAFELTSGRRALIVNCGSGATFGDAWRRAGRATPSHSTLCIQGYSSSRLAEMHVVGGRERELLTDVPGDVRFMRSSDETGQAIVVGHDGYVSTHGLTHVRKVEMTMSGRNVVGEDTLAAVKPAAQIQFDRAFDAVNGHGIAFAIRFHLHPDVDTELDLGGSAISMALKSGEIWVFRHDGKGKLTLEPSVYLEKGRLKPRATKQVVLSGAAMDYATRVRWSLAKAQETPTAIRDFEPEEIPAATVNS